MIDMSAPDTEIGVDERFIDLMCTIQALVDAEFEELVSSDGTESATVSAGADDRPRHGDRASFRTIIASGHTRTASDIGASERSPP
jgi:hypothetical protein